MNIESDRMLVFDAIKKKNKLFTNTNTNVRTFAFGVSFTGGFILHLLDHKNFIAKRLALQTSRTYSREIKACISCKDIDCMYHPVVLRELLLRYIALYDDECDR